MLSDWDGLERDVLWFWDLVAAAEKDTLKADVFMAIHADELLECKRVAGLAGQMWQICSHFSVVSDAIVRQREVH